MLETFLISENPKLGNTFLKIHLHAMILLNQITPVKMIERSVYSGFYCFEQNLFERYVFWGISNIFQH